MDNIGERIQHVPVFVGSTFEDMKDYRRAVRDSLSQLEAIVRGMEYFGSRPGSPIDECLAAVTSCDLYIGLFGMRYGSIPDGHSLSMTHLEYEEAQKCGLPSLIYEIDEDNQPILPKYVETGTGAEALVALKRLLQKRHLVSKFTTPEDLAAKVLHDVPAVLRKIGTAVEGELPEPSVGDQAGVLERFWLLPKLVKGREITLEVAIADLWPASGVECAALELELGATIRLSAQLTPDRKGNFYASHQIAESLLSLKKGDVVRVIATTLYGISQEIDWGEDGPITSLLEHRGLRITSILRPGSEAESPA